MKKRSKLNFMTINIKRAYDAAEKTDGYRILVDRLWPRGIPKEKAKIDLWLKDVAPSDELRKWFGHDPERWPEFQTKYRAELANRKELLQDLKRLEPEHRAITLVYAAKDEAHNDAVVLKDVLGEKG
jgi:uncharacterized protein YeaO (DUF488 family)